MPSSGDRMAKPRSLPSTTGLPAELRQRLDEAVRHHNGGRHGEVERLCRLVLETRPDQVEALQLLAVARVNQGDHAMALDLMGRAVTLRRGDPRLHLTLGTVLLAAGRAPEAISAYHETIRLAPRLVDAHVGLAAACIVAKRLGTAEAAARQALELAPQHVAARQRLVVALASAGRFDEAALERQALPAGQEDTGFRVDLAGQFLNLQRFAEAEAEAEAVLEQRPDHGQALVALAYARMRSGRQAMAEEPLERAVALAGPESLAASVLGCLRVEQGLIAEGTSQLLAAVARPDAAPHEYSTCLSNLQFRTDLSARALLAAHQGFAQRYEPQWAGAGDRHRNDPDPRRSLRLGFVSPDFCAHSVSFFFLPLLEALVVRGVQVFCYANNARSDEVTAAIAATCTGWRDIRPLCDDEALALVRQDRIDVLVDLAGHSADNRLSLFGRRAAPVQLTYLGYAGTTGMSVFDGRITDRLADPDGAEVETSEPLVRLERCFLAYEPRAWPAIAPPPCLERGHVTFGSFNNFSKINPGCLDLWAQVLLATPGSRLALKSSLERHPASRQRILALLDERAISSDRVSFIERRPDLVGHLTCYGEIDIALDTFPYNGTTTTCEALWMGVPVITLAGDRHMARVGRSLLSAVRFEAGIAADATDYVLTATQLAAVPQLLESMRVMLRQEIQASPLADAAGLADAWLAAVRPIWQRWCASHADQPGAFPA